MKLNQKKYERQLLVKKLWFTLVDAVGIFEAVTGFGKTFVAILCIKAMNEKFPDFTTKVVVPSTKLKEDWEGRWGEDKDGKKIWIPGHIETHNLKNVEVWVVNSYVRYKWDCDLLIADECHHYASEDSQHFSMILEYTKFTYFLGLTATLSKKERLFFYDRGITVFDTITEEEAEREGYISKSITYNFGIPKTDADDEYYQEVNSRFNNAFSKFEHDFHLALACGVGNKARYKIDNVWRTGQEWREYYAKKREWNGDPEHDWSPKNIAKYASFFNKAMRERKTWLYNAPSKLKAATSIIKQLKDKKIITFAETTAFADKLAKSLGKEARAYHASLKTEIRVDNQTIAVSIKTAKGNKFRLKDGGAVLDWNQIKTLHPTAYKIGLAKLKAEAIDLFERGEIRTLCTAKALDEGFDVENIDCAVKCSYTSSRRQSVQRDGRSKRVDPSNLGKKAIIINLYIMDTQEEKWLRESQKERRRAINIQSIEDINFNPQVLTL